VDGVLLDATGSIARYNQAYMHSPIDVDRTHVGEVALRAKSVPGTTGDEPDLAQSMRDRDNQASRPVDHRESAAWDGVAAQSTHDRKPSSTALFVLVACWRLPRRMLRLVGARVRLVMERIPVYASILMVWVFRDVWSVFVLFVVGLVAWTLGHWLAI
jgi:hypothetical protein